MANKRIARLNEQVRRELTYLLQRDVRDPRIGIVTVTDVEVSPDLYHARVFYSVMGSDEDRASAAEGLRAAAGFLRTEIGKRMHTRRAPELHFTYDDTLQHAMHIERLLQEALATAGAGGEAGADIEAGVEAGTGGEAGADIEAGTVVEAGMGGEAGADIEAGTDAVAGSDAEAAADDEAGTDANADAGTGDGAEVAGRRDDARDEGHGRD